MRHLKWILIAISFFVFVGCAPDDLTVKMQQAQQVKYQADELFVTEHRVLVKAFSEIADKKHGMQRLIIDNTYADRLRNAGGTIHEDGKVTGQVDLAVFIPILNEKYRMESELADSRASTDKVIEIANRAADTYAKGSADINVSLDQATEALRSAKATLHGLLEALGAFAGGVATGAAL